VTQPPGGNGAKLVDAELGGLLGKLEQSGELRGERGEAVLLYLNGELEAPRLVAAGVGKRDEVDADALRTVILERFDMTAISRYFPSSSGTFRSFDKGRCVYGKRSPHETAGR